MQSPFFKLPAELRNIIYEDVILDINLGNAFSCFGGITYVQHRPINLWHVNRQMYQETRLLPYSLGSITAGPRTKFQEWKVKRSEDQLRAITRLHFVFDSFFFDTRGMEADQYGNSPASSLAVERVMRQQLAFPELSGLRHILVELRSGSNRHSSLREEVKIIRTTTFCIKQLNPQVNVDAELHLYGDDIPRARLPFSQAVKFRVVRFGETIDCDDHQKWDGKTVVEDLDVKTEEFACWGAMMEEQRKKYC